MKKFNQKSGLQLISLILIIFSFNRLQAAYNDYAWVPQPPLVYDNSLLPKGTRAVLDPVKNFLVDNEDKIRIYFLEQPQEHTTMIYRWRTSLWTVPICGYCAAFYAVKMGEAFESKSDATYKEISDKFFHTYGKLVKQYNPYEILDSESSNLQARLNEALTYIPKIGRAHV